MKSLKNKKEKELTNPQSGFSLIEILAVLLILVVMGAMLVPALDGFVGTAGRRGAVNIVMNTIDHARVAALEQGRTVHVLFALNPFPEPDTLVVLREDENGQPSEILSRKITLPKGVLFREQGVFEDLQAPFSLASLPSSGGVQGALKVGVMTFSPRGTVQHPNGSDNTRRIHLADGVRKGAQTVWKSDGFDIISVARYTGRPQLDVSFQ